MNSSDLPIKKRATLGSDDVWFRLKPPVLNSSDSVHSLSGEEIQSTQCRKSEEIDNEKRKGVEGMKDSFVSKRPRMRATMPHQITIFRFSLPDSDCDQETYSDLDEFESEDEVAIQNKESEDEVDESEDECVDDEDGIEIEEDEEVC